MASQQNMLLCALVCAVLVTVRGAGQVSSAGGAATVRGSGSTAVELLMTNRTAVATALGVPAVLAIYDSVGSGNGVDDFTKNKTDFSITDFAYTPANYATASQSGNRVVLQIPFVLGLYAVVFNVPGVPSLSLDACTLADIFNNKITFWNQIPAKSSPTPLPNRPITPIVRSDSSGSTQVLTTYLSTVCAEHWTLGVSTKVNWPASTLKVPGSNQMVSSASTLPYSIGYVEAGIVANTSLGVAALRNLDGNYVTPAKSDFSGLVEEFQMKGTLPNTTASNMWIDVVLPETELPMAYPMSTVEYIAVAQDQTKKGTVGAAVKAMIGLLLSPSTQAVASNFGFAALPATFLQVAAEGWNSIMTTSDSTFGLPQPAKPGLAGVTAAVGSVNADSVPKP